MSGPQSSVAIVGPGAVGITLAAALMNRADLQLLLCGRRASKYREVETADHRRVHVDVGVITDASAIESSVDWILLTVKAHQVQSASDWLDRLCGRNSTVVVLQNGIEQATLVGPFIGSAHLIPAIVWLGMQATESGSLRQTSQTRLVVPKTERGEAFAGLLKESIVTVQVTTDFVSEAWKKLCMNAVTGLEALAGRPSHVFRLQGMQELASKYARECATVARAQGAALAPDFVDELVKHLVTMPESHGSILLDRQANLPLEWEARNGVIQRIARVHGIETPISDVIVPLLEAASGDPQTRS